LQSGSFQSGFLKWALQPYCVGGQWFRLLDAEAERLGQADSRPSAGRQPNAARACAPHHEEILVIRAIEDHQLAFARWLKRYNLINDFETDAVAEPHDHPQIRSRHRPSGQRRRHCGANPSRARRTLRFVAVVGEHRLECFELCLAPRRLAFARPEMAAIEM
jgi:hypothetical protein